MICGEFKKKKAFSFEEINFPYICLKMSANSNTESLVSLTF